MSNSKVSQKPQKVAGIIVNHMVQSGSSAVAKDAERYRHVRSLSLSVAMTKCQSSHKHYRQQLGL